MSYLVHLSAHIYRTHLRPTKKRKSILRSVYSARSRGAKRREVEHQKLVQNNFERLPDTDVDKKPVSKSWGRLIKKVYEVDPLKCPKCNGSMRIKAFIRDPKEISRICENLGLADWRDPTTPHTTRGASWGFPPTPN